MRVFVLSIIFSCLIASPAFANQDWVVKWDNNSANKMTLYEGTNSYEGVYYNDAGNACAVAGKRLNRRVAFRVKCTPTWFIDMSGSFVDGRIIGEYVFNGNSKGTFRMFVDSLKYSNDSVLDLDY